METVDKLIIGVRVRVIVGLSKLINTAVPAKKLTNNSQYARQYVRANIWANYVPHKYHTAVLVRSSVRPF